MQVKKIQLIFILMCCISLSAQDILSEPNSSIIFNFGRNNHGTKDIPGYQYGIAYNHYFTSNLFYALSFEGTLNDSKQILFVYEEPNGAITDGTLNDVTAGFQILPGIGYTPLKLQHHDLGVSINALGRYQATSINDVQEIQFPALTGLPVPIRFISNYEKQRTLAIGAAFKLFYNYKFNSNWLLNVTGAFQTDTNGDTISSVMLGFGKNFN